MTQAATTVTLRAHSPSRVPRELGAALERVAGATAGLVFASGQMAANLADVARALAEAKFGIPWLLASGAGVLTERGEVEDQSALSALVWSGGDCRLAVLSSTGPADVGRDLLTAAGASARSGRYRALLVVVEPECFGAELLGPLSTLADRDVVFGAGTVGSPGIAGVHADGRVELGKGAVLAIESPAKPIIRTSKACRLVTPLHSVTAADGSLVLELDNLPALDVLGALSPELLGERLVMAAVVEPQAISAAAPPDFLLRGIQGVDPIRRGLIVSAELEPGARLGFAVRDPTAARADLEAMARGLRQATAGAAPRFAVYINCAARGSSLYGGYDVDTRILRGTLPDTPIAGLQSSFEIAPHAQHPALHLHTGVLCLFSTPS